MFGACRYETVRWEGGGGWGRRGNSFFVGGGGGGGGGANTIFCLVPVGMKQFVGKEGEWGVGG